MTSPSPQMTSGRSGTPDRMWMAVPGLSAHDSAFLADQAVRAARQAAPKLSGRSAGNLRPYWGTGFFGVIFPDPQIWYQEAGTKGRVMRNLAGKTIPMWIDDPTGTERLKNPKAKTRITASGKTQVLIFRKVAEIGARKNVRRRVAGKMQNVSVPASYPGAPGRIASRRYGRYPAASHSGRIAPGNAGVRWYNPGVHGRGFLRNAMITTAQVSGLGTPKIFTK